MKNNKETSCWKCLYHSAGGINLLGNCKYFEVSGEKMKEVPPTVINAGCRFWQKKDETATYIIKKFGGTFI